jgi:hypothetical protein
MKKILVFLVFITTILKGQSVDPETFPTVVGSVLGKNVYTNTGGEGKFSVQSIADEVNILDTISATYAEFYTLITGGNLQVGRTYILVDFQTVYDQMDFDAGGSLKPTLTTKTGSVEQIWVLALSSNQIAKKAYSATYPNDQIQYDWTYNTTLVNGSPAKGRISERIDENNNRTDYDHREIKFIRYDDGAGNFTVINDNGNASGEFLTFVQNFTGGIVKDNWLGDFYSIGALVGQEYGNNVFSGNVVISNTSSAAFYNNTFSGNVNTNTFSGNVYNNTFSNDVINNTFSGDVYNNTFSGNVYNNTFSGDVYSNTFSNDVYSNTFSGNVDNNTFSNDVTSNTFSGNVNSNTFTYTGQLIDVTIVDDLQSKTIDDATYPFLFNTDYKKEILKGSNGSNYIRYFDGTADVNTLIP